MCGWLIVAAIKRGYRLIGSGVRHASAGVCEFPGFHFSRPVGLTPAVPVNMIRKCGALIPGIECLCIGLPQLLFGSQAIRQLFERHIGRDRRNASDQDNQYPFHDHHAFCPINVEVRRPVPMDMG